MAHNSCPHNLTEVCNAILAYIENPELTIDDIMKYIKGPDFPLKNTIINQKDIKIALATGKSNTSLKVRGDYTIEDNKIIFTTIPYRTYRNKIKEQLEKNVEEFETCMEDFNDESNIGENRIVFFAKPGKVQTLLNKLFKYTDLQTTVSYNMNYIVNGTPKLCSIKDLIAAYVQHQNNVMINIAKTDLEKAAAREHVIEGLLIAIKDIDKAIQLIKSSEDKTAARTALISHFGITEIQANAVLDMKLVKLTKLDKDDLLKELEEVRFAIAKYNRIINEQVFRNELLTEKVTSLRDTYGDERRTIITQINDDLSNEEKEIANVEPEKCVVVMTESGNIKRIPATSFRTQNRNTKGVKTQDDITNAVIRTNTIDNLMIFSDKGRMYRLLVDNIPVGTNVSKGTPVKALVEMEANEKPAVIYSLNRNTDAEYVLFATKNGLVKKTPLSDYINSAKRKGGISATKLRDDDELVSVVLIKNENLLLLTETGMCIRINSDDIAIQSKMGTGTKGITLKEGDRLIAALPVRDPKDDLAVFTADGTGKRIALSEFPLQNRAGKGLQCYKGNGEVSAAALVNDTDNILVIGNTNSVCVAAKDIPVYSRAAAGILIIKNNKILLVTKV